MDGRHRAGVAQVEAHDRAGLEPGRDAGDDGVCPRVLVVVRVNVVSDHGAIAGRPRLLQHQGAGLVDARGTEPASVAAGLAHQRVAAAGDLRGYGRAVQLTQGGVGVGVVGQGVASLEDLARQTRVGFEPAPHREDGHGRAQAPQVVEHLVGE